MDLTPLDVRKKGGDFRKQLRGYDPAEVDGFLEVAAERMEELVRENASLRERTSQLAEALNGLRGREQAMTDALVTAQQLKDEIRTQSQREAEFAVREARAEGDRIVEAAQRQVEQEREALHRARSQRSRFLRSYRHFLEGQLAEIAKEEERGGPSERQAQAEETQRA